MKKRLFVLCLLLLVAFSLSASVFASDPAEFIMDYAGIMTSEKARELEHRAMTLGETYGCGVYVLTVNSMGGQQSRDFAKDFYLENDLGLGDFRNGILFLVAMETRDYVTVTYGRDTEAPSEYGIGILAFTDAGIMELEDDVVYYLSEGDYDEAFETYVSTCEEYLSYYQANGEGKEPGASAADLIMLAIALGAALLIALVVCLVLLSQMKTAKSAREASDYISGEGLELTGQRDQYTHTTRQQHKIEKSSGSGGSKVDSSGFGGSRGGKF